MRSFTSYGSWALVTGASAGIGEAFARTLARQGLGVVLTARREDRLRALAGELESAHGVPTRTIPLDLSVEGAPDRLVAATADLDVGVLINNAGYGLAGRFESARYERLLAMIRLNCAAVAALTHHFLPRMKARGKGAVVIIASVAGYQPVPFNAAYGATKAFDLMLAEALWAETRGSGVDVLGVSPGPTETEFQAVAGEAPHPGATPEQVVATAIRALGRKPSVVVGAGNKVQSFGVRFAPRAMTAKLAGRVMSGFLPATSR
jgi:short-subunit dehydrogenase